MKRFFRHHIAIALVASILMLLLAQPAAAGFWKQKYTRFSATAGETVAGGQAVAFKRPGQEGAGRAYLADGNDTTLYPAVGVVGKGGAAGEIVEVVASGTYYGSKYLSPGARIYVSESTPGGNTGTRPTSGHIIGWVLPSTDSSRPQSSKNYMIQADPKAITGGAYY